MIQAPFLLGAAKSWRSIWAVLAYKMEIRHLLLIYHMQKTVLDYLLLLFK